MTEHAVRWHNANNLYLQSLINSFSHVFNIKFSTYLLVCFHFNSFFCFIEQSCQQYLDIDEMILSDYSKKHHNIVHNIICLILLYFFLLQYLCSAGGVWGMTWHCTVLYCTVVWCGVTWCTCRAYMFLIEFLETVATETQSMQKVCTHAYIGNRIYRQHVMQICKSNYCIWYAFNLFSNRWYRIITV